MDAHNETFLRMSSSMDKPCPHITISRLALYDIYRMSQKYMYGILSGITGLKGWLSPREKGISPLPWGEKGETWQKMGRKRRNYQMCLF
jgi:hypothetical protein